MDENLNSNSNIGYNILAMVIVGIWSASFVATKILLNAGLEPLEIYLLRFSIGYILLAIFTFKRLWADSLMDELKFVLCGATGGTIYFVTENMALDYTYVANVSLIVSLTPIFTALFVSMFYNKDRVGGVFVVGSLVAIAGVAVVVMGGADGDIGFSYVGDLLALSAAVSWGAYSLILKGLNSKYDARFVTRKTLFYGVLIGVPFLMVTGSEFSVGMLMDGWVVGSLLFLSLGATLFCFFMWNVVAAKLGIVHVSNYIYFIPVAAMVLSSLMLDEGLSITLMIGGVMVIGGVIIADKLGSKN